MIHYSHPTVVQNIRIYFYYITEFLCPLTNPSYPLPPMIPYDSLWITTILFSVSMRSAFSASTNEWEQYLSFCTLIVHLTQCPPDASIINWSLTVGSSGPYHHEENWSFSSRPSPSPLPFQTVQSPWFLNAEGPQAATSWSGQRQACTKPPHLSEEVGCCRIRKEEVWRGGLIRFTQTSILVECIHSAQTHGTVDVPSLQMLLQMLSLHKLPDQQGLEENNKAGILDPSSVSPSKQLHQFIERKISSANDWPKVLWNEGGKTRLKSKHDSRPTSLPLSHEI